VFTRVGTGVGLCNGASVVEPGALAAEIVSWYGVLTARLSVCLLQAYITPVIICRSVYLQYVCTGD